MGRSSLGRSLFHEQEYAELLQSLVSVAKVVAPYLSSMFIEWWRGRFREKDSERKTAGAAVECMASIGSRVGDVFKSFSQSGQENSAGCYNVLAVIAERTTSAAEHAECRREARAEAQEFRAGQARREVVVVALVGTVASVVILHVAPAFWPLAVVMMVGSVAVFAYASLSSRQSPYPEEVGFA